MLAAVYYTRAFPDGNSQGRPVFILKKSEFNFSGKNGWQKWGCTCFTNLKLWQSKKEWFRKSGEKSYPQSKDDKNGVFNLYTKLSTFSTDGISKFEEKQMNQSERTFCGLW